MIESLFWTLLQLVGAAGLVAAAFVWGRRVGGAAPWLFAVVAVIDALLILAFRVASFALADATYYGRNDALAWLRVLDSLLMIVSGGLALVGCILLFPKPRRLS